MYDIYHFAHLKKTVLSDHIKNKELLSAVIGYCQSTQQESFTKDISSKGKESSNEKLSKGILLKISTFQYEGLRHSYCNDELQNMLFE